MSAPLPEPPSWPAGVPNTLPYRMLAHVFEWILDSGPWCVFYLLPDGSVARIMRTWTRREARKFIARNADRPLVLRHYWWRT